ncbi:hypothetical protein F383_01176 [Gossypium arboreum]|uniref:Uncharacterized protein n=1 Tax=Gossypium arboreum TaxID=29729 RepID=A0A0B0NFP6_GOSAR|nr:hypothetical protein F383_01176 [Gossypium arboreum]
MSLSRLHSRTHRRVLGHVAKHTGV